jgi:hypothetical protein
MSLIFALKAAVNGPTGPRAILSYGLGRTKQSRRQSGQRPTPGFSRRTGGRAPRPESLLGDCGSPPRCSGTAAAPSLSRQGIAGSSGRPLSATAGLALLPGSRPSGARVKQAIREWCLVPGSGSCRCGASDSEFPVATREIQRPNNQEEGCPSVDAVREAHDASDGRDNAAHNTRDPKDAGVAVLEWRKQASHAGSGRR